MVERYIEMIQSGIAPLPLLLSRSDIAKIVSARLGKIVGYEDISELAHADLLYMTPEKDSIGVEEVRNLISKLHFATGDTLRLVVIDRFDTATEESANALLKTLEDGIPGVVFLLQVDSFTGLLETILSRVVCVSSNVTGVQVREADRVFARELLARRPEALQSFVSKTRWNNRTDAIIFIEALKDVLVEKSIAGEIYGKLEEAYRDIVNTNAGAKYVMDVVLIQVLKAVK